MPDKPRVKAPKQRVTHKPTDPARRQRMLMLGGGVIAAIAVVFVLVVVLGVGGGDPSPGDVREKVRAAGGTFRSVNALAGDHTLTPDQRSPDWNTDPPTNGPHFGFDNNNQLGTVIWGAYEEPVQLARVVHNLEHGGILIFYGNKVKPAVVAQLREFYEDHENGTILAPYPKLGNQIALGAWVLHEEENEKAYLAKLRKFDEDAFSAFFSAFQFKGPERFPESSLLPGQS
jgi:Protein of unknown function (DUF3105)